MCLFERGTVWGSSMYYCSGDKAITQAVWESTGIQCTVLYDKGPIEG